MESTPSTTSMAKDVAVSADAPAWFKKALNMLKTPDLGTCWTGLVGQWVKFEEMEGYTGTSNVSASKRPVSVKDWIQHARSPMWRPTITNVNLFGSKFLAWWTLLQPEWRVSKEGIIDHCAEEGSWDSIRKGGVNGLLSVMAALFFWGLALQSEEREVKKWEEAVTDVDAVLKRLISTK